MRRPGHAAEGIYLRSLQIPAALFCKTRKTWPGPFSMREENPEASPGYQVRERHYTADAMGSGD
jgi:hypothetical protein